MTTAEKYVTAAFLVVLAAVLLWVAIYAFKMARLQREVAQLDARVGGEPRTSPTAESPPAEPGPQAEPTRVS